MTRRSPRRAADTPSSTFLSPQNPETLWKTALQRLRLEIPDSSFSTWLADTRAIALHGTHLTVSTPTTFAAEWITRRLLPSVLRILHETAGVPLTFTLTTVAPPAPPVVDDVVGDLPGEDHHQQQDSTPRAPTREELARDLNTTWGLINAQDLVQKYGLDLVLKLHCEQKQAKAITGLPGVRNPAALLIATIRRAHAQAQENQDYEDRRGRFTVVA